MNLNPRNFLEWSLVSLCVLGLWSISSLPLVFILTRKTYSGNSSLNIGLNSTGCEQPLPYTNGVCLDIFTEILNSTDCQVDQTPLLIPGHNEVITRAVITQLNESSPSDECYENILPFICLYWLGLCAGEEGELVQPTASQCKDIKFRTCVREWKNLETLSGILLPDCDVLPENRNVSCHSEGDFIIQDLACQDNFYLDEDFQACVPNCSTWSEHEETKTTALRATVLTSNSIGIILSIIVLIVSMIKYKQMFQFPTIFLVFSIFDILLIDLPKLIGHSNINLFCSSPTILNSTTTPFCIVSGMVLNYGYVQHSMWWVFHLCIIFWGLWFPFHYNKYKSEGKLKKISIALTVTGIVAPVFTILLTIVENVTSAAIHENLSTSTSGLGYIVYNHLPVFCSPNSTIAFYTYILPVSVTLAIGGPLIVLILYRFRKQRNTAAATDLKLMLVMCFYLLLLLGNMAEFTTIGVNAPSLILSTINYFYCESRGLDPYHPCPRDFDQYTVGATSTAVMMVILAFYPLYVLLFAVNIQKLWKSCHKKSTSHATKSTESMRMSEVKL